MAKKCVRVCIQDISRRCDSDRDSSQLENIYIFRCCLLAAEQDKHPPMYHPPNWENVFKCKMPRHKPLNCANSKNPIPLWPEKLPFSFQFIELITREITHFLQNKLNPNTVNTTRTTSGSLLLSNIVYAKFLAQERIRSSLSFFLWGRGNGVGRGSSRLYPVCFNIWEFCSYFLEAPGDLHVF